MPSLKQDAVQEIKDRLELADLISEHIRLQKAGRDLKGLCPFHQEKTPSFYVSVEKQLWHCYGCNRGGDHFTFIQEIEHVDFRDALRLLAEKTGVELEEAQGAAQRRELKKTIGRLNGLAAQYFHHVLTELPAGEAARARLEARGITRESMADFSLGFAPAGQRKDNLVRFLRKHGVSEQDMLEAGLAVRVSEGSNRGDLWDRFRQRIIIPIHDERGELIAFGGRVMDETQMPKYLNSPQTALYDKGRTLFNLHRARKAIHERKHAVLMEGYFDAITAWQRGVHDVVTTSGTALTEHQVRLLKRETQELVLAFDKDDAGRTATVRAIELASRSGIHSKVIRVPSGKDPDDYLRQHPDGWGVLLEHALPEWEYLLRQALEGLDLTAADDRRRGAEAVIPVLARIPEASVLEIYAQLAAGWLRVDAQALIRDVQRFRSTPSPTLPTRGRERGSVPPPQPSPQGGGRVGAQGEREETTPLVRDEIYLIGLLFARPDLLPGIEPELQAIEFAQPIYRTLCARLAEMVREHPNLRPLDRLADFPPEEQRLVSRAVLAYYPELEEGNDAALQLSLGQCLQTIKIGSLNRGLRRLESELRTARQQGNETLLVQLMEQHQKLARDREALRGVRGG
jgi:DNA primase